MNQIIYYMCLSLFIYIMYVQVYITFEFIKISTHFYVLFIIIKLFQILAVTLNMLNK